MGFVGQGRDVFGQVQFGVQGVLPNIAYNAATNLFGAWLTVGLALYFVKVARGQRPEIGVLFSGGPFFVTYVLATILVTLAVTFGFILLIVPGVILSLMFGQYLYLIVDRNLGVMDSISSSIRIMDGNKMTVFTIWLVAIIGGLVCIVFTCCLGGFAVVPYWVLLGAVCYLMITGQPMADQVQTPFQQQTPFQPPAPPTA